MKRERRGCSEHWGRVIVVAVALAVAAWGCARLTGRGRPDVVFPRLDSAREQFYYAAQYEKGMLLPREGKERKERVRRIIAAYQTVLDHFPGDQIHAPLALASIGNCYFRMKDYRETIRVFKDAKERYSNYPFIHAEAEWMIGRSLERLGKSREAKRHYKRCIDTFSHSKNDRILMIVAQCRNRYIVPSVPGRRGR